MTREQLEHLLRAAAVIANDDEIVVIGSQRILGQFPDAPDPDRDTLLVRLETVDADPRVRASSRSAIKRAFSSSR